jgi:2-polyprenyl-3-methyl-5-hydroxy-6-metoxy-1,4-benzoquinol methylase
MTKPAVTDEHGGSSPRYDFEDIDLDSGSTHADVVLLVGESKRVLELGPATGYMSRSFRDRGCTVTGIEVDPHMAKRAAEFCERVIVGDLDELDLAEELGDERFDAIVAADVLEHLRDPLAALRRLEPFLSDDGAFVLSLPNIAHGSVRLALLGGEFRYSDIGLLDRTHLTFFTRETIEEMLDAAELGIAELHRHELNLDASEVPFDADVVPAELRAALDRDPDARTYQFVVKALPMNRDGLRELQQRLRDAAVGREDTELELRELRRARALELERLNELEAAVLAFSGREGALRHSLIDAHDQLLRRDADLEALRAQVSATERAGAEAADRARDEARHEARHEEAERARGEIAARDEEIRRLRVRLDRILSSPPAKLYDNVRALPGVRRVVARRTAGYEAAVRQPPQSGD